MFFNPHAPHFAVEPVSNANDAFNLAEAGIPSGRAVLAPAAPRRETRSSLTAAIRRCIREGASPRHVPRRILQVAELPRTRSGKSMEMAVARLVNGMDVPNAAVVANPEALEAVREAVKASEGGG